MATPTSRTLEYLRNEGYIAQVVEMWIPHSRTRRDLFGFIDIVAIAEGETIGVQATSTGNMGARVKKILDLPESRLWLDAGNKILVIGFKKYKKAVDRKFYRPTLRWVTGDDYADRS